MLPVVLKEGCEEVGGLDARRACQGIESPEPTSSEFHAPVCTSSEEADREWPGSVEYITAFGVVIVSPRWA